MLSRSTDTTERNNIMPRVAAKLTDPADIEKVVKLRDQEEMKWEQISEAMGAPTGICMLAYERGKVRPKDKVKNATPADIVQMRIAESLSWAKIMARTDLSEQAARSMFDEAQSKKGITARGHRIGRGGRHPGQETAAPRQTSKATAAAHAAKATKAAAPAKKAAKATAPVGKVTPDKWDLATAKKKLENRTVKVVRANGNAEEIKVTEVKEVKNGAFVVVNDAGAKRTLKATAIQGAK
jgi:hypothetical protein